MRLILIWTVIAVLSHGASKRAVWIDTDPSVAPGGHEIDDGIALLQAFHSPELDIRGVSIVFGNADLPTADRIGREIVSRFGPANLTVYTGASGAGDYDTAASRALVNALRQERLSILAIGPVTNVAAVLKRNPELAKQIDVIVSVAGRRPGQQFIAGNARDKPLRDFNFEKDPEAYQVLLDSKVPLAFAPWEISSKVWITRGDLQTLAPKDPGIEWLLPAAFDWLKLWKTKFGTNGFNPFDTLAVGYLVDRDTLQCFNGAMSIEPGPKLVVQRGPGRQVAYCHTPSPRFKDQLLRRLASTFR